jgi:hypothetical protein
MNLQPFPFLKGDELRVYYPDIQLWHNGIVTDVLPGPFGFPSATMIHNSKRGGGVCTVSLEEFSGGNPVFLSRRPPSPEYAAAVVSRARSQLGQHYSALFQNCEHFTTWAFSGVPQSGQLQTIGWIVAIGAVAAGLMASDSRADRG